MSFSFGERIRRWFRREDPRSVRGALRRDHQELAEELEKTASAYRARVAAFSKRLETLSPQAAEQEFTDLRQSQDALRRLLRRIDASEREARELEEELREWEARAGEAGERHADHPDVRAEIIRSELAARGRTVKLRAIRLEDSPFAPPHAFAVREVDREDAQEEQFSDTESANLNPEQLLAAIRHATREAEQWHHAAQFEPEAVEEVARLKSLHAALKRLDREQGVTRDRLSFAVRMRPTSD